MLIHVGDSFLIKKLYASLFSDPRPKCLIPTTPGLSHKNRPSWLALILIFISPKMKIIWAKLATGFMIGWFCDVATNNDNILTRF